MPVRGFLLLLIGCLMFGSGKAGAQARNPHAAVPAPQITKPIPQAGPQRRPGIPANPGLPTQIAPTTLNGKMPVGWAAQVQQTPTSQVQQTPTSQVQPTPQMAGEPQRPVQIPPKPPRVSYVNGQLTVVAENSMMTDVLNAVRSATSIKMEGLGGNA